MEQAMATVSELEPASQARPAEIATASELTVVVAATYTAEPIEGPLGFWLAELGFEGRVEFAPYNQVIQQLLDPSVRPERARCQCRPGSIRGSGPVQARSVG
jgi:hypothetical protein